MRLIHIDSANSDDDADTSRNSGRLDSCTAKIWRQVLDEILPHGFRQLLQLACCGSEGVAGILDLVMQKEKDQTFGNMKRNKSLRVINFRANISYKDSG